MPFDQAAVTSVENAKRRDGQIFLSWSGTLPAGGWWQVYIDRALAWTGDKPRASIQKGPGRVRVDIGAVASGERFVDFSDQLTPPPNNHATLSWTGGTFEGDDLAGWRIYGESAAGGGIDYGRPLGTVRAVEAGINLDGFGLGTFGGGGFGSAAGTFSWTSGPLTSGTWHFAVVPFDTAGNEGTPATVAQVILVPPQPPALDGSGNRLEYSYNPGTHTPTLTWLASPG